MQYRKNKAGEDISVLGYGCMRFERRGGKIDLDKAEKELMAAINGGVNYFDTAYIYPGSEETLGTVLQRNGCRGKINIATKLPQYLIKSVNAAEKAFCEQLKRLKTDYVDYYLMHMLTDLASWEKLCRMGVKEWLEEKKREGKIRYIGFSFHGDTETFLSILNAYDWDFCQIQYNYMDENSQAGRRGLEVAGKKDIPVIIMEPLRGGKLVEKLPSEARNLISRHSVQRSAAEWALRWLWDQEYVTCVLSGMHSMEMVEENMRIASRCRVGEFTAEDRELIAGLKSAINAKIKVGCTGCGYCQPCPRGVDIPTAFRCYNEIYQENKFSALKEYVMVTAFRKNSAAVSNCVGCGLCEQHCPQHIEIRKQLKNAAGELEGIPYKAARAAAEIFRPW